jgi:hypothetical protein
VIDPENTSAVLELYTRFLKCFVSAAEAAGNVNLRLANWFHPIFTDHAKCRMHDGLSCRLHESKKTVKNYLIDL